MSSLVFTLLKLRHTTKSSQGNASFLPNFTQYKMTYAEHFFELQSFDYIFFFERLLKQHKMINNEEPVIFILFNYKEILTFQQ